MMSKQKKSLLAFAAVAVVAFPMSAKAVTTNVDAIATFLNSITLSKTSDMLWNTVEFSALPTVAGDNAVLATAGTITYAGVFSGAGTGTAGTIQVTAGTDTNVIEVFCDATATMSDGAGATIDVTAIQVLPEGGVDAPCAGIGAAATSMTLDIAGGTADVFSFGGTIDGSTAVAFVAGAYSSASAGGNNLQVDVFYQ